MSTPAIAVMKPCPRTAVADKKGERNIDATRFDVAIGLVLHQHLTGTTTVLRWQARTRTAPGADLPGRPK